MGITHQSLGLLVLGPTSPRVKVYLGLRVLGFLGTRVHQSQCCPTLANPTSPWGHESQGPLVLNFFLQLIFKDQWTLAPTHEKGLLDPSTSISKTKKKRQGPPVLKNVHFNLRPFISIAASVRPLLRRCVPQSIRASGHLSVGASAGPSIRWSMILLSTGKIVNSQSMKLR